MICEEEWWESGKTGLGWDNVTMEGFKAHGAEKTSNAGIQHRRGPVGRGVTPPSHPISHTYAHNENARCHAFQLKRDEQTDKQPGVELTDRRTDRQILE